MANHRAITRSGPRAIFLSRPGPDPVTTQTVSLARAGAVPLGVPAFASDADDGHDDRAHLTVSAPHTAAIEG